MSDTTCSASSLAAEEPLAGTAVSGTRYWLGIEIRAPWGPRAIEEVALPAPVRAALDRFEALEPSRIQLLRRPDREGPLHVVFADTTPGAERRHVFALDAIDDLASLDLDGLVAGTAHATERTDVPEVWACTHGARDACCGLKGGQAFLALREHLGDRVWQTSHLGGHRFAPTLLWLPHGLSFGRVRPEEVGDFVRAAAVGEVYDPMRLRGRCGWSPAVQAAEVALRRATGFASLEAPRLVAEEAGVVRFALLGREHAVQVRQETLPDAVIPSCGKPAGPAKVWRAFT